MSEAALGPPRRLPAGIVARLIGKLSAEVGPLLVFFLVYAWWDVFVATAAYAVATLVALAACWTAQRRLPVLPLISTGLVALFATLTIALDNDLFIKLKPTVVNGFYALLLGGGWLFGLRLVRRVLAPAVVLDEAGERILTWRTTAYLALLALTNEAVWRTLSLHSWVVFKVFIVMALNLLFVLIHIPFVRDHRVS